MADELDKFLDSVLGGSPKPQVRPQPSIDDKIDEYSKANGVDSKFVRAVMGQESAGNPNAKSWANAKGLLQILPETGKRYRKDFDPFNIDHNLDVGTRHLAYLEKKYKGDKKRVLAAYNAGEGNADQKDWWEQSQFWSNDRAVQKGLKPRGPQDKTNTRNYIEKIYGNYEKMSGGQSKDALDNFLDSVLGEPSAESALPTQAGEISETSTEYATPETLAKYGYQGDTWGQPSSSTQTPSPTVLGQQTIKIPEEPQLQGIVNPYLPKAANNQPNVQKTVENYSNDELEAGYKEYLDYTKEQDSPATKQKYLSLAGGTKSFGQPTEIKTQIPNEEVSRVGVPPTQTPQPDNYTRQVNTERYTKPEFYETAPQQTVAREVKTDEDYLETNASRIAVDITRKPSGMNLGEYILRTSLKANQPKYGYSDADIERVVADNKATYGNFTKQNYADWDDNQFGEIVNQFKRKYNGSTYINFDVSRNLINRTLGGDNKRIADQLALEKPQVVREVSNPESLVNTVNRLTEGEAKAKTIEDLRNPSFSKIAEDTMTKALQRSTRAVISPFFFAFDAINDIKQTFSDLQGTVPLEQKRIDDEIKNIEKSYGSFADYQQIQATRRNMDWGEYGLRFGTNIVRSAVRTAVADSLKGIEVIGDLEEKVNPWSYLLPDRYAPSVRNLGNLIGFTYAKVKNPNITYDQMPGADSDIDKRLFYNIGKSIDESLGEDKYLRGTFGDALSQGLGSGVGFMLMGFLAPEASIAGRFSISSAILGTLTSAGSGYSEAKGENLTETQAKTYAYIQGLAGASEGFGVGATFAKSFKNANLKRMFLYDFASWLKSSGKSFLEGGAEEALQEFFQSTVGKSSMEAFKDKEPSVYQRALNIVNRLPGQMANTLVNEVPVAFLTGGLMDSSVQSIEAVSSRNEGIRIDAKNNLIQMEGTRFSFDDKLKPTVEAWQQNELVLEKKYQEIQQVGKLLKTAKTPEQKGAAYERLLQIEKEVEGLANQSANLMQDISGNITPTDKQPNIDEVGEIAETPIAENLPSNEAQNQATAELQSNKQVEENQQVTPETKEKTGLQSNETLPTTKQESPSMESPEVVSSPMVESENEVSIQPKPAVADTSASKNNQSKNQSKPVESSTNISAEPVKQNRVLIEPKAKIEPVEETKTKHEFSSTQVNLPKKESAQIRSIGTKLVKDADLAKVDWNPRETEPHITVKYGLHTNNVDDVREIISAQRPFTVKLGKTSIFPAKEGSDYDVVKIDVDSPELHAINKAIAENTKVTDTHPTYQPHVTIAYVKKGEGQKYVGNTDFEGKTLTFNSIAFSDKDGKMVEIPLSKDTQVSTAENKDTSGEENTPQTRSQIVADERSEKIRVAKEKGISKDEREGLTKPHVQTETNNEIEEVPVSQRVDVENLEDSEFTRSEVLRKSKNEKIRSKTGFTKTQEEWFIGELQKAYDKLEPDTRVVQMDAYRLQEVARNLIDKGGKYKGKSLDYARTTPEYLEAKQQYENDIKNAVVIDIPGDGTFKFSSAQGINSIHKKLTGKTIEEFRKVKSSDYDFETLPKAYAKAGKEAEIRQEDETDITVAKVNEILGNAPETSEVLTKLGVKQISNGYWISNGRDGFTFVVAPKPISLKNLEGFDLFAHKYRTVPGNSSSKYSEWRISDAVTGLMLVSDNSLDGVIAKASNVKIEKFEKAISKSLADSPTSPRYEKTLNNETESETTTPKELSNTPQEIEELKPSEKVETEEIQQNPIYSEIKGKDQKDYKKKIEFLEGYKSLEDEQKQKIERQAFFEPTQSQYKAFEKAINRLDDALKIQVDQGAKLFGISDEDFISIVNDFIENPTQTKKQLLPSDEIKINSLQQKEIERLRGKVESKGGKVLSINLNDKGIVHLKLQRTDNPTTVSDFTLFADGNGAVGLMGGNNYIETDQGVALKSVSDLPTPTVEGFDSKAFEKELESIQLNKDSDGKILAPNGKISNIQNERLAKTIRTKAFKDWFGDWENSPEDASYMVDSNGEPKIFYHRSNAVFDSFDKSTFGSATDAGWLGEGFYFYGDQQQATYYGQEEYEVFLNIRNPYYASYEDNSRLANADDIEISREFSEDLKSDGYDGVYYDGDLRQEAVAFEPTQIKSIFNQGSFDAENPSILKKVREEGDDDEQIRLAKAPTHELFDGEANFDKDGNLELSLKAAENIRRHLAELYYQKYGKETDEQIFGGLTMNRSMLRNLAKALKTTYDTALSPEMGYTAEELTGHKTVLDAVEKLAKETPVGVVYAFDEDLPEELFHKLDLMAGRTDGEAINQIKQSKIWQYAVSRGSKFYSQYGSQSVQNQISEIVAKLATDQGERYGFTDLFDSKEEFEQAKEELLNIWADGVLRKLEEKIKNGTPKEKAEFVPLANEIQKYATKEKETTQNESADSGSDKSDKNESSSAERSDEQSESATEGEESGRYAGGISEEQSGTRLRTPKYAEKSLQSDEVQYEQEKMSETERKGAELTRTVGIANILDQVRVATGNLPALMAAVYQEQKRLNALADKFKEEGKEAEYNATLESLNALSTDIITAQIQSGRAVNIAKTLEPLSAENAINVLTRLKRQFTGNENESLTTAETKLVKEIQAKLDKASRNLRNKTSMVDRLRKKIKDITDGKYILRPRKNKDGKTERPQTFIQKAVAQKLNSDFDELLAELQSDVGLLKSVWRFDTARPQVSKTDKSIFWHGSDNGDLRGGTTGLHIGTFQAAKEALEARIGVPAEGEWDGTREYGKTKLAGRKTLDRIEKETGKYIKTGHNVGSDLPENDYFPQERSYRATYSNGELVPLNAMPVIEPVKITGKMTNSTWSPHDDYKANGYMKAALKKGNAKNGYYYKNEAEDYGSISAVVPNEQHLERLWKDVGTSIDDFVALKSVADKRLPAQFKDAVSKVGAKILNDGLTSGREFNDKEFAREISQTLGKEFSPYSDEIIKLSWEKLADLKLEAKRQKLIDEGMTAEQADAEMETKKNLARARAQAIASIRAIAKREARHQLTRANYEAHLADNDKLSAEEKANIIHAGMILSETKGLDTNSLIKKIREELGVSIDKALQIAKQAKQAKDEINARLREEKLLAKGKLPEEIEAERESRKEQMQATNEMNQLLKTVSDDTGLIKRFNNDFRAKLVLNHATQLFNMIQSATPVIGTMSQEIYTDVWDTALRAIRRKMGKENELDKIAPNVGFDALLPYAYLFSSNRQVAEGILAEFPEEYFRLELGILPDVNLDLNQVKGKNALSKLAHKWFDKNQVVNEKLATITGAKWQEAHFRSLTFLATLDQIARDKGDKLKDVLEQNRAGEYFTEAQIKNAVDKALRVTFAEQMDDRVGKSLKRLYDKTDHYLPVLLNPAVYARFTYTVSRAVINAHTFGMLDAESLGGNGYNTRSAAKGIYGLTAIGIGLAMLANFGGGDDDDKWYHLYFDGKDNPPIDVRRFFPVSAYVYTAYLIRRSIEGRDILKGRNLGEKFAELFENYASLDFDQYGRSPGMEFVRNIFDSDKTNYDLFKSGAKLTGNFFAGFLRFFKPIRQLVAQIDADESAYRNYDKSAQDAFVGELAKSVPFVGKAYGAEKKMNPITKEPVQEIAPLAKMVGLNFTNPMFISPNPTPATEKAEKLFPYDGPANDMNADQLEAYRIRKEIKEQVRAGKMSAKEVEPLIDSYEKEGKLTERSADYLKKSLTLSDLQETLRSRFSFADEKDVKNLKQVWETANPIEQNQIADVLERKLKTAVDKKEQKAVAVGNRLFSELGLTFDYKKVKNEIKQDKKEQSNKPNPWKIPPLK